MTTTNNVAGTETFNLGGREFGSRLMFGTGKNVPYSLMRECIAATGAEIVTVAIRRIPKDEPTGETLVDHLDGLTLLPNTALCYNVKDAVLTAQLARELLETDWVKLEVIGDPDTLFPDPEGTLQAARELVKDGFKVFPYCSDDPILCMRLEEIGCAAVMPLAAPIGSGLGVRNRENLMIIREKLSVPMIVDAGVGTASDASVAMELGADAVLLQTAVYAAQEPLHMARAMKLAVEAGYLARKAGRMPRKLYATASSPEVGVIGT